jgi:tRNA(Ile)-lysidine synthetase-like protein
MKLNKQILNLAFPNKEENTYNILVSLCSGGIDSIAITHFLRHNEYIMRNFNFTALHIDHNYRSQNYKMLEAVHNFCRDYRIFSTFDVLNHKSSVKKFTESYLRECRESVMNKHALRYRDNVNYVYVTGHHLDDCVEGYLLNCIRGQSNYDPLPCISKFEKYTVCRPFILNTKNDFIKYCEKNDLMKYVVEDTTNSESKGSRRNMIRNEIIPLLNRDNVGIQTIVKKIVQKRISFNIIKH